MENLIYLMVAFGLCYLMMRLMHGSHAQQGESVHHGVVESEQNIVDPVCGNEVDIHQRYGKMHEGHLYHFCSMECLAKFEANRDKYIVGS